ncbi:hypothetical protein OIO90_004093 [Microbotryomycetes sp. JL221]|nr:hypothetical protein OIO90_004093 [Microbotryomycetes sp. JL221]
MTLTALATSLITLSRIPVAQAQVSSVLNLTTTCQTAAASLLSTPFATCSSLFSLASTFAEKSSIIPGLDNWLQQACPTTCSQAETSSSEATLMQGCQQDINEGSILAQALVVLVGNYTFFQDFVCLQSVPNNSYCLIDSLSAIENTTSTITASALSNIVIGGSTGGASLFSLLAAIPPSIICTDCIHALITQLSPILGPDNVRLAGTVLNSTCGPGFVNGKIPTSVRLAHNESTNGATNTSGGSGASGSVGGTGSSSTSPPSRGARSFNFEASILPAAVAACVTIVAASWTLF